MPCGSRSSRDADRLRHLDGRDGRVRAPARGEPVRTPPPDPERLLGAPAHSAELLPALAGLLEQGGTGWDEVSAIAVGVGPGTFTGLRIGVATARGLGQALGVPLQPVSSLEALAAGIAAGAEAPPGTPILPLIDARRGQVFAALHLAGEPLGREWGPRRPCSGGPRRAHRAGGRNPPWRRRLGVRIARALEAGGSESSRARFRPARGRAHCRSAGSRGRSDPCAPERVHPVYVRLPDAEITRSARSEAPGDGPARCTWPDDPGIDVRRPAGRDRDRAALVPGAVVAGDVRARAVEAVERLPRRVVRRRADRLPDLLPLPHGLAPDEHRGQRGPPARRASRPR